MRDYGEKKKRTLKSKVAAREKGHESVMSYRYQYSTVQYATLRTVSGTGTSRSGSGTGTIQYKAQLLFLLNFVPVPGTVPYSILLCFVMRLVTVSKCVIGVKCSGNLA